MEIVRKVSPEKYLSTRICCKSDFCRPFTFVNLNLSPELSPLDGVKNVRSQFQCSEKFEKSSCTFQYPSDTVHKRRKEFETITESVQKASEHELVVFGGNFNCQIDKEKMLQDYLHHNHAANHEDEDGRGRLSKVEGIDINGRVCSRGTYLRRKIVRFQILEAIFDRRVVFRFPGFARMGVRNVQRSPNSQIRQRDGRVQERVITRTKYLLPTDWSVRFRRGERCRLLLTKVSACLERTDFDE